MLEPGQPVCFFSVCASFGQALFSVAPEELPRYAAHYAAAAGHPFCVKCVRRMAASDIACPVCTAAGRLAPSDVRSGAIWTFTCPRGEGAAAGAPAGAMRPMYPANWQDHISIDTTPAYAPGGGAALRCAACAGGVAGSAGAVTCFRCYITLHRLCVYAAPELPTAGLPETWFCGACKRGARTSSVRPVAPAAAAAAAAGTSRMAVPLRVAARASAVVRARAPSVVVPDSVAAVAAVAAITAAAATTTAATTTVSRAPPSRGRGRGRRRGRGHSHSSGDSARGSAASAPGTNVATSGDSAAHAAPERRMLEQTEHRVLKKPRVRRRSRADADEGEVIARAALQQLCQVARWVLTRGTLLLAPVPGDTHSVPHELLPGTPPFRDHLLSLQAFAHKYQFWSQAHSMLLTYLVGLRADRGALAEGGVAHLTALCECAERCTVRHTVDVIAATRTVRDMRTSTVLTAGITYLRTARSVEVDQIRFSVPLRLTRSASRSSGECAPTFTSSDSSYTISS